MITKGDIVNGALVQLAISGITVSPSASDNALTIQFLDDMAGRLSIYYDTGYKQPASYGGSIGSDDSGLTVQAVGAFRKLLAAEIYGLYYPRSQDVRVEQMAREGERDLANLFVNVGPAQLPDTLPIGSGNEYEVMSNRFYPALVPAGAITVYKGDNQRVEQDWEQWLNGAILSTVTYTPDAGLLISEETATDTTSDALVSFTIAGQAKLCITAVSDSGAITTRVVNYYVSEC